MERELEETGRAVERALNALGHDARFVHADLATYDELQREPFDAAFNVCERIGGRSDREPHAAAILEAVGLPYTGSSPITLATCMDKERVKDLLVFHGIPTPRCQVFRSGSDTPEAGMEFPVIVKPAASDNSIGIGRDAVADDAVGLLDRVKRLLDECDGPVLAEEFLCGREFNVSILDAADPPVLPLGEIVYREEVFGSRGVCSYEAKWDEGSELYAGSMAVCPAKLEEPAAARLAALALEAYRVVGCRDYGRVDIRLDGDGSPSVLEINPNPGIAPVGCGFTRAAAQAGLGYEDMIGAILGCALAREQARREMS